MSGHPPSHTRPNTLGDRPEIDPTAYVDPSALIIGKVRVGPRTFIGPCAVIRADELDEHGMVGSITIGPECNVQDGVIIHSLGGQSVTIGSRVSLAHGCVVHGPCTIGDDCFVGFRAIVYSAQLMERTFVGHGAIVESVELRDGVMIPSGSVVNSTEAASHLTMAGPSQREFMRKVIAANIKLAQGYAKKGTP
ncbi:MAG: hypothetical protein Kow0099_00330 [Candidatus Abyssubacteria bacterium]